MYVPKNPPWHQPIQSDRSYTNGIGADVADAEVLHHVFAMSNSDDENRITRLAKQRDKGRTKES